MLEIFIQSFVLYFVVIDPIGNTPIFMSITKSQSAKEKYQTSYRGGHYSYNNFNIYFQ